MGELHAEAGQDSFEGRQGEQHAVPARVVAHGADAPDAAFEGVTERLNISAEQLAYVTNADPGSGLLFFQNVILPFRDEFPKDTELYKLLTTKPSEVAHDGESR